MIDIKFTYRLEPKSYVLIGTVLNVGKVKTTTIVRRRVRRDVVYDSSHLGIREIKDNRGITRRSRTQATIYSFYIYIILLYTEGVNSMLIHIVNGNTGCIVVIISLKKNRSNV